MPRQAMPKRRGAGAVRCLFEDGRAAAAEVARACTYLELSTSATFNELYVENMGFEE